MDREDYGDGRQFGDGHYRAWVGPPRYYDRVGALQFVVLTLLGLREHHRLLDVGCGSLRGGRLAIVYLRPERYFGVEPAGWALEEGKLANLGEELIRAKRPSFLVDDEFEFTRFGQQFDYILVHSVFSHCSSSQVTRCLREARKVMHQATILIATYLEAESDYTGDVGVYPGVARYTDGFMADRFAEVGLKCTSLSWPHPYDQRWLLGVLPGNSTDFAAMTHGSEFSYESYLAEELEVRTGRPTPSRTDSLLGALHATGWGP